MHDSSLTPPISPRRTRSWRGAVLAGALVGVSVLAASCSSTTTSATSGGSTNSGSTKHAARTTTPSTSAPSTSAPSTTSAPATSATGVAAVCADVRITQATLIRTDVVPADDAQKILADSQSSGNAKLESEASTLASASHVLDKSGTAAALATMAATCHEVAPAS
jgi:hypothetical protein